MKIGKGLLLVLLPLLMSWVSTPPKEIILKVEAQVIEEEGENLLSVQILDGKAPYKVVVIFNGVQETYVSSDGFFLHKITKRGVYFIGGFDTDGGVGFVKLNF